VRIPAAGLDITFAPGETIHTESSYKFSRDELVRLARQCGFREQATYTDNGGRYALGVFIVA